jgi:hypothetical protein
MPPSSEEILSASRTELARGRPRAALREMERARSGLLASSALDGLRVLIGLVHEVHTLAPADTKARERLLVAVERDIQFLSPDSVPQAVSTLERAPASPPLSAPFSPYSRLSTEQILAPARAEIERHKTGRAVHRLEKARRTLLARGDLDGLEELIELARRIPVAKPRHESAHNRLIYAARQNVRYLSRRAAIKAGEEWSDPFAAAKPKTKLPSLPPMTRREKLIAAAIVVVLAGCITTLALLDRIPQRAAHAIKCPTGEQGSPTWSPDGKEIAFAGNRECGTQITVVSVEDGRLKTVTNRYGVQPDWSPDGQTILYRSRDGFSVVPAQGGESRLVRSDDGAMGATWSPDGRRITFVHGLAADPEFNEDFLSTMYTMKPDGSDVRRLLGHSCNPGTPAWSPDGSRLVFSCHDGIYVMRLATRKLIRIENRDYSSPVTTRWSPDGRQIAIGYGSIEIVNADGSGKARYLHEWKSATGVAWSPDGKRIAFSVVGSDADDGLYVIDRDGSQRRRLVKF